MDLSQSEISYSYYINRERNLIFICYKSDSTKVNCYFFNMKNNSFIYNYNELECENNINNYYFKETNKYALVCQNSNKINLYILDGQNLNQNFAYSTIYINKDHPNLSHNLFLFYNSKCNGYNIIDNAYNNYTNEYIKTNYSINTKDFNDTFIQNRKLEVSTTNLTEILKDIPQYIKDNYIYKPTTYKSTDYYNIIIKESNTSSSGLTDLQIEDCLFFLQFYSNYTKFIFLY
jgi:hypothetical protein